MVEPAALVERRLQRVFAGVTEWRMADIVRQAQSFGEVFVETQRARDGAADLRDFQAMCQPDAEMVAIGREEDLGLVPQAAEADRVDDAVAVALKRVARAAGG